MKKNLCDNSGLGILFIFVSAVTSGALISRDRIRANNVIESKEDRIERNKMMVNAMLLTLLNILIAAPLYFIYN